MNIFYWAVVHLLHSDYGHHIHKSFYWGNTIAAIVLIAAYVIYALFRFIRHRIGGLYTIKRLLIALILAGAVYRKGGYVAFLLGL